MAETGSAQGANAAAAAAPAAGDASAAGAAAELAPQQQEPAQKAPAGLGKRVKKGLKHVKKRLLHYVKRYLKDLALGYVFPRRYRRCCERHPVVPGRVVFFDAKEKEPPASFELICGRLQADPTKSVVHLNLQQNFVRFLKYYRNCYDSLDTLAQAQVIYLDDASDFISCLPLRPETRAVQLWHACGAFKKWGMCTADKIFGGTRESLERHPFYRNLSLVTVSSPEVVWAYAEAMDLKDHEEVIQPVGVSRTDVFFDEAFVASARAKLEEAYPPAAGKKVILYAPTFRGRVKKAKAPDELDIHAMMEALGDEYVLIIKHHPYVKKPPAVPEECGEFAHVVHTSVTTEQLLCTADVCISDYSSVVFEYSLFSRPMLFFAYDIADYDDWRGFFYSYEEFTPGPVVATTAELIENIRAFGQHFDPAEVDAFREKFMSACDGHATDRILAASFPGEQSAARGA